MYDDDEDQDDNDVVEGDDDAAGQEMQSGDGDDDVGSYCFPLLTLRYPPRAQTHVNTGNSSFLSPG